jgi:hypothetical protein
VELVTGPALGTLVVLAGLLWGVTVAGLIRIGDGPAGVVERSYPAVVSGTAGPSLADRLLPAPRGGRTDGAVRLTLDPRLQHAASEALRCGAPAGIVVLDATDGDVLVSAGTPPAAAATPPDRPDRTAAQRFAATHDHYVRPDPDGRLADDRPDPCVRDAAGTASARTGAGGGRTPRGRPRPPIPARWSTGASAAATCPVRRSTW